MHGHDVEISLKQELPRVGLLGPESPPGLSCMLWRYLCTARECFHVQSSKGNSRETKQVTPLVATPVCLVCNRLAQQGCSTFTAVIQQRLRAINTGQVGSAQNIVLVTSTVACN